MFLNLGRMFPLRALRDPMPNLRFGTIKSVPRSRTQASVGLKAPQLIPVCSQGWRSLPQSTPNTHNQVTRPWTRTSLAPPGRGWGEGHRTAGFPAAQENMSSGALPDHPMGENGLFQNFCACLIYILLLGEIQMFTLGIGPPSCSCP